MRGMQMMGMGTLGLTLLAGCVSPTVHSERVDVVHNPELLRSCTLKGEGKYTAVGEKNALTMARNATAERGGNVLLVLAINKGESLTTEVHGKLYACERRP
ncbi:MAG: hypothetical protein FJZ47_12015 [Candidatus Tectomicrobia bacterium]|uniref:DUF4156 domain-containing protein n=1 Tax=Tectimicrobiota bacterium TaxID=2528274 RepID=A0A937W0H2_UNCTE|nr:hypothetical protein [Candidatus Tectomicrobia bacterium]